LKSHGHYFGTVLVLTLAKTKPSDSIVCMTNTNDLPGSNLIGRYCRHLPDGELVVVEEVHPDGTASVRRVGGERAGTVAICNINDLQPE
jgi:hypothetical protein